MLKDKSYNNLTKVLVMCSVVFLSLIVGCQEEEYFPEDYFNGLQEELWIAAKDGDENIVKSLLNKGAFVNVKHKNGATPLWIAAQNEHDNIVKLLIDKGANVNTKIAYGFTPLF